MENEISFEKRVFMGSTSVQNDLLNLPNLNFKEKGMFVYLYSKPAGWNFSSERILKDTLDKIDSVLSGLKSLEKKGYLQREKENTGRIKYILHYPPINPNLENPGQARPKPGKSLSGKTHTISNNIINNIINTKKERDPEIKISGNQPLVLKPEPVKKYNESDIKIAKKHFKAVKEKFPNTTTKFDEYKWADAVRMLRTINKYSKKQIKETLKIGLQDNFWGKLCHSLPALRNRSKNGKIKFENLFLEFETDQSFQSKPAQEYIPPHEEFKEDITCQKICLKITEKLKDKFHGEKRERLLNLVERIAILRDKEPSIYKYLKDKPGHLSGVKFIFHHLKPQDIYLSHCHEFHSGLDYLGFKDIDYGTDCWRKFESKMISLGCRMSKDEVLEYYDTDLADYLKGSSEFEKKMIKEA